MSSSRAASARQVNALQAIGLLLAFTLMAGIGGLLAAGLMMPAVATTSAITDTSVGLFDELDTALALPELSEKTRILASDGTLLATVYDENRIVVPLEDISQDMRNAVIDVEDRRFYEHGGVDLFGMARAIVQNKLTGSNQGASTLTQQYVKNMLIQAASQIKDEAERAQAIADAKDATPDAAGYARKLREAKLAATLEKKLSKDEILAGYLNVAQFGASVYGVEAAAQRYFSVSAKDLDYLQAATIAGVTKSPVAYDPERFPADSQERRDIVLFTMLREKHITQAEYTTGVNTPIEDTLKIGETKLGCSQANASVAGSGYFCDYVIKVLIQNPVFGETDQERRDRLYRGGLTIHTTLDPNMENLAKAAVEGAVPTTDSSGVAVAMSVVEPGTGKILAMAQNRSYSKSTEQAGNTLVNFNTDKAYGGSSGFPPGSTFKPFTLLEWLKEGHALREVVSGTPRTYQMSEFSAPCSGGLGNGTWPLRNSEGGPGLMSVMDATRNSVNNAFADMATQLDLCSIFEGAQELGVYTASGDDLKVVPSNIIGTDSIAPLTMASAFAAFSADGMYCEPVAIEAVEDNDGNSLAVPDANCRQAISPELARAVTYALSFVWNGTASNVSRLPDGRPASGKTGTTSENEHTWFVGFTKQLSTAVWVGHPEGNIPMQGVTINGVTRGHVYGSTIAAPAWRAFMAPASDGTPVKTFESPPSSMIYGVQVSVPNVVGTSVRSATSTLEAAGFHVKVDDRKVFSDSASSGAVASTSPGPGSRAVRGSVVTLQISKGPEPVKEPEPTPDPTDPTDPTNPGGNGHTVPPGDGTDGTTTP